MFTENFESMDLNSGLQNKFRKFYLCGFHSTVNAKKHCVMVCNLEAISHMFTFESAARKLKSQMCNQHSPYVCLLFPLFHHYFSLFCFSHLINFTPICSHTDLVLENPRVAMCKDSGSVRSPAFPRQTY